MIILRERPYWYRDTINNQENSQFLSNNLGVLNRAAFLAGTRSDFNHRHCFSNYLR